MTFHSFWLFSRDELGNYILRSTEQLELKLFVRVTNTLEDAHEAILVVLLPSYLKYRGTDGDVSKLRFNLL